MGFFGLAALLGCALVWGRAEWVRAHEAERPVVTEVAGEVRTVDHLAAKETVRLLVETKGTALPSLVRISVDQDRALPDAIAAGAEIAPTRPSRAAAADGAARDL